MSSMLEKLNQMKEVSEEKEIEQKNIENQQTTPQMSIGQQLEIMSKVKEIEYQNSLVMMSLEKYNKKFKELKTEQIEQLENIKSQVKNLKESNRILSENMEKSLKDFTDSQKAEILILVDKANKVLQNTEKGINEKAEKVRKETEMFISDCEEQKQRTSQRYKTFYDRWKWLDILIMIDLAIMPIIMIILACKVFSK